MESFSFTLELLGKTNISSWVTALELNFQLFTLRQQQEKYDFPDFNLCSACILASDSVLSS